MRRDLPFNPTWWNTELVRLLHRLENLSWDTKRDLLTLHGNMCKLVTSICREDISCRRKGSHTERYQKLVKELHDTKDVFDQHLIQALLSV